MRRLLAEDKKSLNEREKSNFRQGRPLHMSLSFAKNMSPTLPQAHGFGLFLLTEIKTSTNHSRIDGLVDRKGVSDFVSDGKTVAPNS